MKKNFFTAIIFIALISIGAFTYLHLKNTDLETNQLRLDKSIKKIQKDATIETTNTNTLTISLNYTTGNSVEIITSFQDAIKKIMDSNQNLLIKAYPKVTSIKFLLMYNENPSTNTITYTLEGQAFKVTERHLNIERFEGMLPNFEDRIFQKMTKQILNYSATAPTTIFDPTDEPTKNPPELPKSINGRPPLPTVGQFSLSAEFLDKYNSTTNKVTISDFSLSKTEATVKAVLIYENNNISNEMLASIKKTAEEQFYPYYIDLNIRCSNGDVSLYRLMYTGEWKDVDN